MTARLRKPLSLYPQTPYRPGARKSSCNPGISLNDARVLVHCLSGGHPLQSRRGAQVVWRDERPMSVTSRTKRKEGGIAETVRVIIHALIIALIIRTFFFQPFNIPSGSMKDTLLVGDYLFVSKYTYGYSKYSFPLSPSIFSGRVPGDWLPERGDVVVFRLPKDLSTDYIKRVIGLPGERIQMINGVLHINGTAVRRERIED